MARSEEEVAATVQAALRVVEEAAVPEDLRSLAFEKAFDSLTGHADGPSDAPEEGAAHPSRASGGFDLGRVAAKLGVDAHLIERVLDFDDEGVHIVPPRSRFHKQKSVAIQQVATLIAGARQAAGLEEWTSQGLVRKAAEDLGVDDPSNFATHMKKLDGARTRGSGKTGEVKLNSVGFEAAGALIGELAGEAPK